MTSERGSYSMPLRQQLTKATFAIAEGIITAGGTVAVLGVHGVKVDFHLEKLWCHNITLRTRLVDTVTTSMLLKTVQVRKIEPGRLITHRFKLAEIIQAYGTFSKLRRIKP